MGFFVPPQDERGATQRGDNATQACDLKLIERSFDKLRKQRGTTIGFLAVCVADALNSPLYRTAPPLQLMTCPVM